MEPAQQEEAAINRFLQHSLFFGGRNQKTKLAIFFATTAIFLFVVALVILMPPFSFPKDKIITIKPGTSLAKVSALLDNENIIRSRNFFELCAKLIGGEKPVRAGQYLFKEPVSACSVALRIARGISGIPAIRITIPEGMSNNEIADILEKNIPQFDTVSFLEDTRTQEGFLFPDTYFLFGSMTIQDIETIMTENFNKKTGMLADNIKASKHSLRDIVIMASILEKEATTKEDKELVSGILWKRISIGMPLQVDATFMYLLGKKSSDLTVSDLQMKSSYNTYQNRGLPAGPIGNPGLLALQATITPKASPYLYYLSDYSGVIHYAKTFEEHKANKLKYLRQ